MISVVVYGRNDTHGYNLHKRVVLSLNCISETLNHRHDEIIFVDYNTPDDHPTFIEATADMLTAKARRLIRVLRVRPAQHRRFYDRTHLAVLEPVARNVGIRRSDPDNRWILSSNTDMIFLPRGWRKSLSGLAAGLPDGHYHVPRFELPETLWESFDRRAPRAVMRRLGRLAHDLHLDETVEVGPPHLVDAPGDFQLVLRRDLFAIDGLDESMLLGWHVDSNLPKRLTLLRGEVRVLSDRLQAFHCDHTRQATATHGRDRIENDWARYVDNVTEATLPGQRDAWGLPDEQIEEISVRGDASSFYVRALLRVLPPRRPADPPYRHVKTPETFNDLRYPPEHMAPYLADLLNSLPRAAVAGYFGCRRRTAALFADLWEAMGFSQEIVSGEKAISAADLLIFEFGYASQDKGEAPEAGEPWSDSDMERLGTVRRAFYDLLREERARLARGCAPRRVVLINAVHNVFEPLLQSNISFVHAPYGTRVRQGHVLPGERPPAFDRRAVTAWLQRRLGRALPPPQSEVVALEEQLRLLLSASDPPTVTVAAASSSAALSALLDFPHLDKIAPELDPVRREAVRAALAAARPGARLAAEIVPGPTARERAAPLNALVSVGDWENPAWRAWAETVFGGPEAADLRRRGRWLWERAQLLYGLDRLGALGNDRRLLVMACGPDPLFGLLSQLADRVEVADIRLATAKDPASASSDDWADWARSGAVRRPSALRIIRGDDVPDEPFADAVLAPQNAAFRDGLLGLSELLAWATRRLKVGGVLAFSAETVLNDAPDRSWLRRAGLDRIRRALEEGGGFALEPFDAGLDMATLDRFAAADSPEEAEVQPLVVRSGDVVHAVGMWFLVKQREIAAAEWLSLRQALLDNALPDGLSAALSLAGDARRRADGAVEAPAGDGPAHMLFGPYLHLPAGLYWIELEATAGVDDDDAAPALCVEDAPALCVEAVIGGRRVLGARRLSPRRLAQGPVILRFETPPEAAPDAEAAEGLEIRVSRIAGAGAVVRRLDLRCRHHGSPGSAPPVLRRRLLDMLSLTAAARRDEDGVVRIAADQPVGHALFGPYLHLPAGPYCLEARISVDGGADGEGVDAPAVGVDVVIGGVHVLCAESFTAEELAAGPVRLPFRVPDALSVGGAQEDGAEFRIAHGGVGGLRIEAMDLLIPLGEG